MSGEGLQSLRSSRVMRLHLKSGILMSVPTGQAGAILFMLRGRLKLFSEYDALQG